LEVDDPRDWLHRATAAVRLQDLLQLGLPKRRRWAWRLLNAAGRKVWVAKPAGVPAAAIGPALARLDELRHRSPAEAADGARWLALHLCPRLAAAGAREAFVRCLAVYASAIRMHGDTDLAARVLSLGLGLAPEISPDIEADLCLRSAYVLRDFGRFRDALAAVGEAGALYGRAGDSVGMAKTQVDRGALLYLLGDLKASVRCYRQALKGLPLHMSKSRAAAYHGLGVALHGLGEPGAEAQLGRAAALLEHEATYGKASSLYTQASLARERGDTGEAEALYRDTLELLRGHHHPLAAARVCLDLLEILLQRCKLAEAREERHSLNAILVRLEGNPVAHAAIYSLLCFDLSRERIEEVRRVILPKGVQVDPM
jgi:tetratricopeptide (TPR) repeat protein